MANKTIPEELDVMSEEYLTDGIITSREREVLLRKADKLGLDRDEIDLYIDARQQKADQAIEIAVNKQRGQSCPYCGGSIPQLTDKCPHCGQTITAEASDDLKEIIENLEDSLVDFKSGKDFATSKAKVEKYMRKAQLYYSNNPKIKVLIQEVNSEIANVERAKEQEKIKNQQKSFGKMALVALPIVIALILSAVIVNSQYGWGLFIILGLPLVGVACYATSAIYKASYKKRD